MPNIIVVSADREWGRPLRTSPCPAQWPNSRLDVPAAVCHAQDKHVPPGDAVDDDISVGRKASAAWAQIVVSSSAGVGVGPKQVKSVLMDSMTRLAVSRLPLSLAM